MVQSNNNDHVKKRVLITGGAGYVGSALTPYLLSYGYQVTVFDLFLYGSGVLAPHPNLRTVSGDIRDISKLREALIDQDIVIHLACISNDPSFELNPELGKSVNLTCFEPLVKASQDCGVSRFIFASSSSVYGVKEELDVTESSSLEPLTDYSRLKVECEDILRRYNSSTFATAILRPATVCGYASRQRLDVVVNILTTLAFYNKKIIVLGGGQLRPNIHIQDMIDAYLKVIEADDELITGKTFNVGGENMTVDEIARLVRITVDESIEIEKRISNDNRSYHICSDYISLVLDCKPKFSVHHAILNLVSAFRNGLLDNPLDNELYYNIKRMQRLNLT